jgi:hypothetical protein
MTKPVRDYLARCMEDAEFAEAYQELEAEHQAERARIQARIHRSSLRQALKEIEKYFNTHSDLVRVLDWLQIMRQQEIWLTSLLPAGQPNYANTGFQISSEADYDAGMITTETRY